MRQRFPSNLELLDTGLRQSVTTMFAKEFYESHTLGPGMTAQSCAYTSWLCTSIEVFQIDRKLVNEANTERLLFSIDWDRIALSGTG